MKVAIFAFLVGVCGLALAVPPFMTTPTTPTNFYNPERVVDKMFLEYQKNFFRLLMHVHQPNSFVDQVQIAKTWDFESNFGLFTNQQAVEEFVELWHYGFLPRGEIFSVMDEVQRKQVISLFHVFYYAKNIETFYKVACWARDYVNEGMFVYAFTVGCLHRPDCQGFVLPAPYEIYPHFFINSEVMTKAKQYKMQHFAMFKPQYMSRQFMTPKNPMTPVAPMEFMDTQHKWMNTKESKKWESFHGSNYEEVHHTMPSYGEQKPMYMPEKSMQWPVVNHIDDQVITEKTYGDYKTVVIPSNYTGWYLDVDYDQALTYFTEDIGLNAYYYYFHADYPFWMSGTQFGLNKDRRGELFFYVHQQLLARYYLERLSNGLGDIDLIDVHKLTDTSFYPSLRYESGLEFARRMKYSAFVKDDFTLLTAERINILEKRILDAIDSGFVWTEDGTKIPLYSDNGINMLGNLIEGNPDSPNLRMYRYIHIFAKVLFGFSGKPISHFKLHPSVLEHYETCLRDPVFYSIYKKVLTYFFHYKNNLPSYTYTDLAFKGVKIENVVTDKLITYFDHFDVELNNGLFTDFTQENEMPSVIVKARQMRLNHKPFTYNINVMSDKNTKVVIRVFLGPKFNEKGHLIDINENRMNFVEMDKFIYELKVGKNVIERNSRQAHHTVRDRTSYFTLYKKIMSALQGTEQFIFDQSEAHCGFPNRLLLPKGRRSGMVFQFFVMVTPYVQTYEPHTTPEERFSCGVGTGLRFMDKLPLGYPFDRHIDVTTFFKPGNMYMQDVVIFHKKMDEINMAMNI